MCIVLHRGAGGSPGPAELYNPQVAIRPGTYRLGPSDGTLAVRTKRTGPAAKAGHNLLMHVTGWEATLEVGSDPGDSRLELSVDGASLTVKEGVGGMQALGDDDKAGIEKTIDDEVLKRQTIAFRSTEIVVAPDGDGLKVQGDLTLNKKTAPLAFDVAVDEAGALSAVAVIKQSNWGMKPYSTLWGALKVVDEIEVAIEAVLPAPAA
jgi:polyisoprenoid-binding protein YceI